MATGLKMFSVVEELSSPAFRKIAALVSPKRGYPELPTYPTIPALPIVATIKVPTLVFKVFAPNYLNRTLKPQNS